MNTFDIVNDKKAIVQGYIYETREREHERGMSMYPAGSLIQAMVIGKSESRTYMTTAEGINFDADSGSVRGEVGDELYFQVIKSEGNQARLKQVARTRDAESRRTNADLKALFRQAGLGERGVSAESELKERIKSMRALSKIRRRVTRGGEGTDINAVRELIAAGFSLNRIDLRLLTSVINELADDAAPAGGGNTVEAALEQFRGVKTLDEQSAAGLLREGKALTLANIYIAKHSGAENVPAADTEPFETLLPEVLKTFRREGLQAGEENLDAAKALIQRELPVTRDNVENFLFLRNLGENVNEDDLRGIMREYAAEDRAPADLNLRELKDIVARRGQAERRLQMIYEASYRLRGIDIDTETAQAGLDALRAQESRYARSLRLAGASQEHLPLMSELFVKLGDIGTIKHSIMGDVLLGKISFTVDAMHIACAEGIGAYETFAAAPQSVYGDSFERVRSQFPELLKSLSLEPREENIKAAMILSRNMMDVTQENLTQVKLLSLKIDETLNRLHPFIAASMLKDGLNPLEMHLDEVLEYIDTFNDIFGTGLEDKLAEYTADMDADGQLDPNSRGFLIALYRLLYAVRGNGGAALCAAAKGGELTLGGLLSASKYLRPHQALDRQIDGNFGLLEELRFSEDTIRGKITQALQREAARLTGEDARCRDGTLLTARMGRTAENMSRYNEMFAAPDLSVADSDENARSVELVTAAYYDLLARAFGREAEPDRLRQVTRDILSGGGNTRGVPTLEDTPLEEIFAQLRQTADAEAGRQYAEAAEALRQAYQAPALLYWMERMEIPVTPANIAAVRALVKNPYLTADTLDKSPDIQASDEEPDSEPPKVSVPPDVPVPTDGLQALRAGRTPEEIFSFYYDRLRRLEHSQGGMLEEYRLARDAIKVQNRLWEQGGRDLRLPVSLGGRTVGLNLYILNERFADKGTLLMALNTKALGKVQIRVDTGGSGVSFKITSDSGAGLEHLRQNAETLRALVTDAGFDALGIEFDSGLPRDILAEEVEAAVEAPKLFTYEAEV
ncbi:MAG: DUF6240 domain-containing protein [Clostridiales bacterium]|nr:DUF6240 domain-containing protein [Clostridiales bacterium]